MTTSPILRILRMAATEPIRRPRARALTLIEVLIALGIVLALSVVVLPLSSWAFSLRALESARDGMEAIILQSRAHARLSARAVEVRVVGNRLEARFFDPAIDFTDAPEERDSISAIESFDETGIDERTITDPWARRRLPMEVEAVSWEDYLLLREQADGLESAWMDPFQGQDDISMRIAVLLPDGGALVGEPIILLGPDGGALRINVDSWTGRPRIDVPPEEILDLPDEDEEEEEETPAPEERAEPEPRADDTGDLPADPVPSEETDS